MTRMAAVERLRDPKTSTMPNNPGRSAAYRIRDPRSNGRSSLAVGKVVVMWKLMSCDELTPAVGGVQIEAGAGSVQLKLTVPVKPDVNVTVTVASTFEPCATWKLEASAVIVWPV